MIRLGVLLIFAALACREKVPSIGAEPKPRFDRKAAHRAMFQAAELAASCARPAGPVGVGQVVVRYEPSGAVSSVGFKAGAFAGTEVGRCVQDTFLKARIPAFEGPVVFVDKHFEVR